MPAKPYLAMVSIGGLALGIVWGLTISTTPLPSPEPNWRIPKAQLDERYYSAETYPAYVNQEPPPLPAYDAWYYAGETRERAEKAAPTAYDELPVYTDPPPDPQPQPTADLVSQPETEPADEAPQAPDPPEHRSSGPKVIDLSESGQSFAGR